MGLILSTMKATSSTLKDQWKEYFYCDALDANTICVKAHKKVRGFGNHGDDNIISDGSVIAVADGQCMVIVEQGKVVDLCAEPGEYVYDSTSEPSIFTGTTLSSSIKDVFATIGKRITFGGQAAEDQRVYYFNTKEIPGLKYGTASPVPFRVVDTRAGIDLDISLKAFGEYSIKISDPILFYTNVCANVKDVYHVSDIENQMRTELLTALQPAFARLGTTGIRYSEIPAHTQELAAALNVELSKKWKDIRGVEIVSFGVSSIKADAKDEEMIKQMQRDATYVDPRLASAALVGAQTQAMKDAANNTNGASMGFFGMQMAQASGGINANALYQQSQSQQASWTCPQCGSVNSGKFCSNCGTQNPQNAQWICPKCGNHNVGNFCNQCGGRKPQ